MAIITKDLNKSEDYISELDPCKTEADGATIFVLKPLVSSLDISIRDGMSSQTLTAGKQNNREIQMKTQSACLEAFRFGVVDIRNLEGHDGKVIKIKRDTVNKNGKNYDAIPSGVLEVLDSNIIAEVGSHILASSEVKDKEAKN